MVSVNLCPQITAPGYSKLVCLSLPSTFTSLSLVKTRVESFTMVGSLLAFLVNITLVQSSSVVTNTLAYELTVSVTAVKV